jgi:hypothetical protein
LCGGDHQASKRGVIGEGKHGRPPGYSRYLFAMFADVGVLTAFASVVVAAACWMLASRGSACPSAALTLVLMSLGSAVLFNEPIPAAAVLRPLSDRRRCNRERTCAIMANFGGQTF